MTSDRSLEVRNVRFVLGPEIPRYWHGGRRSTTLYHDALSIFFPHGEMFFVTSVRALRSPTGTTLSVRG